MEIELNNTTYEVIFDYDSITLKNKINNETSILNINKIRPSQRILIEKYYNDFLENIIPRTEINTDNIKQYKKSKLLKCLLTPRQISIVLACLNIENKTTNNFEGFCNISKHYIYDNSKIGKSFIPLELSSHRLRKIYNKKNANTNIVLISDLLINQWKTLLKTVYKGKYYIIDSLEKLQKCLVFGPIKEKTSNSLLLNNVINSNINYTRIYNNYNKKNEYSNHLNTTHNNLNDIRIIERLYYDNKFINPKLIDKTNIILITASYYSRFVKYFKNTDFNSISRIFVDSCFNRDLVNINFNKIKYYHVYYLTNDYKLLLHNKFKTHLFVSNKLKEYYNVKSNIISQHGGYFPNSNYMVNNIVLNLDYNISKLVISPDKSIPIIIPLMKLNIHNLKFRLNYLNIKNNIINLLKAENYDELISILNLRINNIDKLIYDFKKSKMSSSIIERITDTDQNCPICLENIDVPLLTNCCYNKLCLKCYIFSIKETNKCPCCRTQTSINNQYILECEKINKKQYEIPTLKDLINKSKYKSKLDNLLDTISYIATNDLFSEKKFIIINHKENNEEKFNYINRKIIEFNKYKNNYTSFVCQLHNIGIRKDMELIEKIDQFNNTSKYNCLIIDYYNYKMIIKSGYNFTNINNTISINCKLTDDLIPKIINTSLKPSSINHFNI